jgi:hypothetical protein
MNPYVVVMSDGSISVRMRPDDTQGNFLVEKWEAVQVGDRVLIQGQTWKQNCHSFELDLPLSIVDEEGRVQELSVLLNHDPKTEMGPEMCLYGAALCGFSTTLTYHKHSEDELAAAKAEIEDHHNAVCPLQEIGETCEIEFS